MATTRQSKPARRRSSLAIDVHTHIRLPVVEEFARRNPAKGGGPGKRDWVSKESAAFQKSSQHRARSKFVNPKTRLRDMDRMGIDIQMIQATRGDGGLTELQCPCGFASLSSWWPISSAWACGAGLPPCP